MVQTKKILPHLPVSLYITTFLSCRNVGLQRHDFAPVQGWDKLNKGGKTGYLAS